MFQCGICHKQSEPREKGVMVVLERRTIEHPFIAKAHEGKTKDGRDVVKDDPGGTGTAIVSEVLAHIKCGIGFESKLV
jgi:hypothetical protein